MKRLTAALFALVALVLLAGTANADGYKYTRDDVTWGSADSTYCYIPSGASIAVKNSDIITFPDNTYWCDPADSLPQIIVHGTISAAGASTDSLDIAFQYTFDGANYIPAIDWDLDDAVHVGAGLYFTVRVLPSAVGLIADGAAGVGTYVAAAPNTYQIRSIPKGATGMRIVIHPSHAARTLNGKLSCNVRIPVMVP